MPDSISTDLHIGSMNAGMKDMLNVMSKFLTMGMPLDDVILRSTWNPAREIKQRRAGQSVRRGAGGRRGAAAGERAISVSSTSLGRARSGTQKLVVRTDGADGKVVWDLNGITREDWDKLPAQYTSQADRRWDGTLSSGQRGRRH